MSLKTILALSIQMELQSTLEDLMIWKQNLIIFLI